MVEFATYLFALKSPLLFIILSTPTIFTLFPGVTLSDKCLSQVNTNVLGISPVGMSSGASYNLRVY